MDPGAIAALPMPPLIEGRANSCTKGGAHRIEAASVTRLLETSLGNGNGALGTSWPLAAPRGLTAIGAAGSLWLIHATCHQSRL